MPRALQEADDALDLDHRDRVDAGKRLVQQDEARLRGQRARDLHAPPLAARQRRRRRVAQLLDAQVVQQAVSSSSIARPRQRPAVGVHLQLEHGADVLLHGQLAEDRGLLRQVGQAQARAAVDRQALHRLAVDADLAGVGTHQADHHVEAGRLAGAVGAEQAHHLAGAHGQVHVLHDHARAVALLQAAGLQPAGGTARRCRRCAAGAHAAPEAARLSAASPTALGAGAASAPGAAAGGAAAGSGAGEHGAHAAARVGRRGGAALDAEDLGGVVPDDRRRR